MRACIGRFCKRVQQLLGRIVVREALGEIDCPVFVAYTRHSADDGIRKSLYSVAQLCHIVTLFPSELRNYTCYVAISSS